MYCKDCGSRQISWEIDSGYVIKTYSLLTDKEVDSDFVCDSLVSPKCNECGSTNLGEK